MTNVTFMNGRPTAHSAMRAIESKRDNHDSWKHSVGTSQLPTDHHTHNQCNRKSVTLVVLSKTTFSNATCYVTEAPPPKKNGMIMATETLSALLFSHTFIWNFPQWLQVNTVKPNMHTHKMLCWYDLKLGQHSSAIHISNYGLPLTETISMFWTPISR